MVLSLPLLTPEQASHGFADPDDWSALVRLLGGSDDSWTGDFLRLVGKSDAEHLNALSVAAPAHCAAWQAWWNGADGAGAGIAAAHAVLTTLVGNGARL